MRSARCRCGGSSPPDRRSIPDALRAPANVTVVAAAPHSEVLRHTSAVVTHGGHGTVVRTLAADVPMVILHHGRDQADNATRVTTRGAGLAVKRTATPAVIAAAVRRVLDDPAFASGARQLGESIRPRCGQRSAGRRAGGRSCGRDRQ